MDHILGYFLCLLGFLLAFIPLITFTGSALMQADRNRRKSQDSRRPGEGHLGSETLPTVEWGMSQALSILAGATSLQRAEQQDTVRMLRGLCGLFLCPSQR